MSRRSREREVREGVGDYLKARGASDPAVFLSGVGVLIETCKQHELLDFRFPDHHSIREGLEELRERREGVVAIGGTYTEHGGRTEREAWTRALLEWVGVLEATTMLMHAALEKAGVEADQELKPVELPGIVPASDTLNRTLVELDILEDWGTAPR